MTSDTAKNKLIIALDVETVKEARKMVAMLRDYAGMFKIGSQLFTAAGPAFIREIIQEGGRVFLDLKFHDIPNTVAAAGVEAARLGVSIFNVHASGGSDMMRRTIEALGEVALRENLTRPSVIAVTVLTSTDAATLSETGVSLEPEAQVIRLARLAKACGMDGVVASPLEVTMVRAAIPRDFLIVTPGVRPLGASLDDQKRVMTPAEAICAGADYLVVGRAIIKTTDPARAARNVLEEISGAQIVANKG